MSHKLRCKICGEEHKNTSKNFPVAFYERQEVFEGKGKNKKSLGIQPVLVGYGCKKCVGKHERSEFIKQHSIKPAPGQRMIDAIRNKIDVLKTAPKHRIVPPAATKPKSGAKVKNWIKERFFKRRGRE